MVAATRKTLFIHFPKNAGRWISETYIKNVKGAYYIGDPTYNAHDIPDTINGKKVFVCVRDPVTWLHSLWHHRARKKGLYGLRSFNWQNKYTLEKKGKSKNFYEFLDKVIELDNPIFDYYSKFIPNIDELNIIYFENLSNSLISFLECSGESFNKENILKNARFPINTTNRSNKFNQENSFKLDSKRLNKLLKNNKKFYKMTNYSYKDGCLEYPKSFKKISTETLFNRENHTNNFLQQIEFQSPKKSFLQKEIYAITSNQYKPIIQIIKINIFQNIYKILKFFFKIYVQLRHRPSHLEYKSSDSGLSIEFGGGHNPMKRNEGYLNIDSRSLDKVDIVCRVDKILDKLEPNSVNSIYSRHFLEHLTKDELSEHLEDCQLLLKENGILEGLVHSTEYHIIQLLCSQPGGGMLKEALAGFNGWQRGQDISYWDVHKSTFTYSYLKYLLMSYGYNVEFKRTNIKNIHFIAKPNKK